MKYTEGETKAERKARKNANKARKNANKGIPLIALPKPINYNGKHYNKIINHSDSVVITWVINNICTNSCSYCPVDLHTGKNHHYDWNTAKEFINECFDRYGKLHFSVAGGEPSISPFFKEMVDLIYDRNGTITLTTNLAKSAKWWGKIASKMSSLGCSYHPEFMLTQNDEDLFFEKIAVTSKLTGVSIRVMMHPDYWDKCMAFYNRMKDSDLTVSVEIVRILDNFGIGDPFCVINYTEEQDRLLNETPPIQRWPKLPSTFRHIDRMSEIVEVSNTKDKLSYELVSGLTNSQNTNFEGWTCNIGLESLFVHYNGNVIRGNCGVGGCIGNINTSINWPTTSIICNKNECHCATDVLLSKEIK